VYQFTKVDILELFAIRKALEGFAVETIANDKIALDVNQLNKHLQRQQKAIQSDNFELFIQEDRLFHEKLIQALHNKRLSAIYSDLRQSIELLGLQRFKIHRQRNLSIAEHTMIIKEIEKGDPQAAKKAVYNHLDSALELLLQNIAEET
jgi:DNA-binding GntR family transcriptional regulator